MKGWGFFTKTEYGLLILSALFFLVVSAVFFFTAPRPSSADYTITAERTGGEEPPVPAAEETAPVNINTAGTEELMALPGIGPVLAARIVEHREENGPFTCPEELMAVRGIGESLFDALRDKITTEEP